MKRLFSFTVTALMLSLVLLVLPLGGEEKIYDSVIRLHVLANSDSIEDQTVKLKVRDAILEEWGETFSRCKTKEEAEIAATAHLSQIENTGKETLKSCGIDAPLTVTLTPEVYPTREYGEFSLPGGTYLSLRVMIGEAKGANWWCVLYPPLCLDACLDGERPLTDAQWGLMTKNGEGKYRVKFRVLELLEALFATT